MSTASLTVPTGAAHNEYHRQAASCAQQSALWAALCGLELAAVKARLSHGEWIPWIEQNCEFSRRTASSYLLAAQRVVAALLPWMAQQPIAPSALTEDLYDQLRTGIVEMLEGDHMAEQRAALIAAIRPAKAAPTLPAPPSQPKPAKPRKPALPREERPLFTPKALPVVVARWKHTPADVRHTFLDSIREEALAYLAP